LSVVNANSLLWRIPNKVDSPFLENALLLSR
jgi:hypothetical protein